MHYNNQRPPISIKGGIHDPQGFGFENKGTEALSFRQVYGCFFRLPTSGSDGVKTVICRQRFEFFECYIEEGAFRGYYLIPIDYYKVF